MGRDRCPAARWGAGRPAARGRRRRRGGPRGLPCGRRGGRRRRPGRPSRAGRPAHPPARAGPGGRRDGRDRDRRGRARRVHRGARDGQHRPGRRHRRCRGAGVAARPRGGALRRAPGRRGHRRAPGGAAGRARRHGRLGGAGPGVLRRRCLRLRRRPDAPRAGVRQGVRRGRRPARPGPAAHRGRPDERGGAVRGAGAAGLAGRRGGGGHRPRRAAGRPRRLAAARLPRLHRRVRRDPPVGQVQGLERHRRGHPAPPAAHRRAGAHVRPALQGEPAAAHLRRRRRAA